MARNYLSVLERPRSGYRELRSGEALQLDDVAVWKHYGTRKTSNGYKYGHIGHIALDRNGEPILVSLLNGIRGRTTRILSGARFFRKVR